MWEQERVLSEQRSQAISDRLRAEKQILSGGKPPTHLNPKTHPDSASISSFILGLKDPSVLYAASTTDENSSLAFNVPNPEYLYPE